MKHILISTLIFAALSVNAQQSQQQTPQQRLQEVLADYEYACLSEDCKKGLKKVKKYARWRSSKAQLAVGMAFFYGDGLKQNTERAVHWLKQSYYNKNDRFGQKAGHTLVTIFTEGIGVEKDIAFAEKIEANLIRRKYPPVLYAKALDNIEAGNNELGIQQLKDASEGKFKPAMYLLAQIYQRGELTEKNTSAAAELYQPLVRKNYRESRSHLEQIVEQVASMPSATGEQQDSNADNIALWQETLDMEVIEVTGYQNDLPPMEAALERFRMNKRQFRSATGSRIKGIQCGQTSSYCSGMSAEDLADAEAEGGISVADEQN